MKETILAIILGSLLGFGLTGTYFAVKKSRPVNTRTVIIPTETQNMSPTSASNQTNISSPDQTDNSQTTNNTDVSLIIDSPENEAIVNNSQITIKGTASPLSTVVITTTTNSYITNVDTSGNFSQTVDIESGVNQIQIDAIDQNDNQTTKKLLVTYSTAKI